MASKIESYLGNGDRYFDNLIIVLKLSKRTELKTNYG